MATSATLATSATPEPDLLQHVAVQFPCAACGQHWPVSLRQVLISQELVHQGCPVCSETDCLPLTYAALADETAVRHFEESWNRLVRSVRAAGLNLTIQRPALSH